MATRFSTSLVLAIALAACSSDADVLTYDEFKAQAYQEPDTGLFVFNGDELVETEAAMQELYDGYLQSVTDAELRAEGLAVIEQPLIVNRVGNADDKWSASAAQNLTYCISSSSFGSRYSAMVTAMTNATAAWESATGGGVNFVHQSSSDGNCTRSTNVVFNLRQVNSGGQYLARAFFPSSSRRGREVLVDGASFGNINPWTLAGILRHELGHTIGFRHEHTRPESGTCFENNQWRALTAYDRASVMHYPQCNGSNTGDLVLTNLDKAGANALY